MAKHLSSREIEAIVSMIHGWTETLTWDAICDASQPLVGKRPTRQSLNAHEPIVSAYRARKNALKAGATITPKPSSLRVAGDRINRLESIIGELKAKNIALKEQFVIWQYNAYKHGLKEHQLNEELPRIDRERSVDA